MAVTNFIQQIWSKKIQDDLELKCKLVDNCLRDYEGDCKYAQSVKILGVGDDISCRAHLVRLSLFGFQARCEFDLQSHQLCL